MEWTPTVGYETEGHWFESSRARSKEVGKRAGKVGKHSSIGVVLTLLGRGRSSAGRAGVLALVTVSMGGMLAIGANASFADPPPSVRPAGGALPERTQVKGRHLPKRTRAKVRRVIRRFKQTNRTPGVLIDIWGREGRYVRAKGVADLATGERLERRMQFKLASQTKGFTANLILQLVGEGKVSLGDHISDWIAGVPNGDRITIRQLLNHTSGLADGFSLPVVLEKLETGCTPEFLLTAEAEAPPIAPPGAEWHYSNYGYNLLGRVVELATGQDLSTAIQERIAEPLGLRRTFLPTSTTDNGLSPPFARGYGNTYPTRLPVLGDDATDLPASCLWAHGGMVSTLADMRVFTRAQATGELLKPSVRKQVTRNALPFEFPGNYDGPGRWRYGLGIYLSGGFIGGQGSMPGYESTAMYSPSRHVGFQVVSMKQANAVTPPPMFQALAMTVFGRRLGFGLSLAEALEPNCFGVGTPPNCAP
ncbi:MAG: serine hydrolase domain-containing protein [Solirubrobacterales bacterium]